MKLEIHTPLGTRCPYCHDDIEIETDRWRACGLCLARHHTDCWLGDCASCKHSQALALPESVRPPQQRTLLTSAERRWMWPLGFLLGLLVLGHLAGADEESEALGREMHLQSELRMAEMSEHVRSEAMKKVLHEQHAQEVRLRSRCQQLELLRMASRADGNAFVRHTISWPNDCRVMPITGLSGVTISVDGRHPWDPDATWRVEWFDQVLVQFQLAAEGSTTSFVYGEQRYRVSAVRSSKDMGRFEWNGHQPSLHVERLP